MANAEAGSTDAAAIQPPLTLWIWVPAFAGMNGSKAAPLETAHAAPYMAANV